MAVGQFYLLAPFSMQSPRLLALVSVLAFVGALSVVGAAPAPSPNTLNVRCLCTLCSP